MLTANKDDRVAMRNRRHRNGGTDNETRLTQILDRWCTGSQQTRPAEDTQYLTGGAPCSRRVFVSPVPESKNESQTDAGALAAVVARRAVPQGHFSLN